jgi:hypothetical protein
MDHLDYYKNFETSDVRLEECLAGCGEVIDVNRVECEIIEDSSGVGPICHHCGAEE